MDKSVLVKCRNCQNLEPFLHPEGMICRCSKGFFDADGLATFFSILTLKSGCVRIWQAITACGSSYAIAGDQWRERQNANTNRH